MGNYVLKIGHDLTKLAGETWCKTSEIVVVDGQAIHQTVCLCVTCHFSQVLFDSHLICSV